MIEQNIFFSFELVSILLLLWFFVLCDFFLNKLPIQKYASESRNNSIKKNNKTIYLNIFWIKFATESDTHKHPAMADYNFILKYWSW